MAKKPTVLMILDGFGLNDNKEANAAKIAKTPVIDKLMAESRRKPSPHMPSQHGPSGCHDPSHSSAPSRSPPRQRRFPS